MIFFLCKKNLGNRHAVGKYFHFKRNGKYNKHQCSVHLKKNRQYHEGISLPGVEYHPCGCNEHNVDGIQ